MNNIASVVNYQPVPFRDTEAPTESKRVYQPTTVSIQNTSQWCFGFLNIPRGISNTNAILSTNNNPVGNAKLSITLSWKSTIMSMLCPMSLRESETHSAQVCESQVVVKYFSSKA